MSAYSPELQVRLLGFCLGAIMALFVGLYIRSTDALGEGQLVRDYKELVEIGVSQEDARKLVTETYAEMSKKRSELQSLVLMSTLFAEETPPANCEEMNPARMADDTSLRARYLTEGGNWKNAVVLFDAEARLNSSLNLRDYLTSAHTSICA
jgi:hypothetical protein